MIVKLGKLVSSLVLTVSIEDAVIDMGEGQAAGGLEVSLVSTDEGINLKHVTGPRSLSSSAIIPWDQ